MVTGYVIELELEDDGRWIAEVRGHATVGLLAYGATAGEAVEAVLGLCRDVEQANLAGFRAPARPAPPAHPRLRRPPGPGVHPVRARTTWADALMYLPPKEQVAEIRQMFYDAMDAVEQSGIDAALTDAEEVFMASSYLKEIIG